ncbi:MAG: hypothetical protein AAFN77_18770 [Planctomycetota bacterium]
MTFKKPTHGLDFITFFWLVFPAIVLLIAPFAVPLPLMALFVLGLLASIGIWADLRFSGYIFALVNLVAAIAFAMMQLGMFEVQVDFAARHLVAVGAWFYGVYAGIAWARSGTTAVQSTG